MRPHKNPLVQKWRKQFWRETARLHHGSIERLEDYKNQQPSLTIWLGGPGRNHRLYAKRLLIKRLLEEEGFEVIVSENHKSKLNLAAKEILEYDWVEIVFILSITPGASGEALDFAHVKDSHQKLYIYYPEEYKTGYVYQSLYWHHNAVKGERIFSLKKFRRDTAELPLKILHDAINLRIWRRLSSKLR